MENNKIGGINMERLLGMRNLGDYMYGLLVGFVIYLVGGVDNAIRALLVFMAIDCITGITKGIRQKSLSSRKLSYGLTKKITTFFMIILAHQLDLMFGNNINTRFIVICFYVGNEGLSIIENAAILGIPVPTKLKSVLEQCKEKK